MVDQDLLDRIAATVADLYQEVEVALIRTIARRLRDDLGESPYQRGKLDAIASLQRSARLILATLQATRDERIRQAIADAYRHGWSAATDDLPERWYPRSGAGRAARRAREAIPNTAVVERLAAAVHQDIGRLDSNILRAPIDAYRAVQATTAARIATIESRRQAAQAAWQALVDRGIVDFRDRSGRRWRLSSYVEMASRTNIARAATQAQTDRLASIGHDLVIVSNAPQECKLCRPWEGQVLALRGPAGRREVEHATTGTKMIIDVVATLDEARRRGLQHPNCRHSVSVYLPGVTRQPTRTADPDGDAARQRQRAIERQIRRWKEREAAALTDEAKRAARRKIRAWQAQMRQHLADHPDLKRLRYREQVGAGNIPPGGRAPGGPAGVQAPPEQLAI